VEGVAEVVPVMAPQYNVRIPDPAKRAHARELLERAHVVGGTRREAFYVDETGDILTVTPFGLAKREGGIRYFFPGGAKVDPAGHLLDELFVCDTPTPKQGMHHPTGLLALWGKDIRAGLQIPGATNLDIAPTLLALLGVPHPASMKGRALSEAWGGAAPARPDTSRLPASA
jgi:hypothetical protein